MFTLEDLQWGGILMLRVEQLKEDITGQHPVFAQQPMIVTDTLNRHSRSCDVHIILIASETTACAV
jgi:hypothetical protein